MLQPLRDQVIVRPLAEENQSKILITPEQAKKRPTTGEVVAVGSGRVLDNADVVPVDLRPGNVVLFGKYSGHEVTHEGEKLFIMKEIDIFAVLYANREQRRKDQ